MKKFIILLLLMVFLPLFPTYAEEAEFCGYESYTENSTGVTTIHWHWIELEMADADTFVFLGKEGRIDEGGCDDYAIDKNYFYEDQYVLYGIDPKSFVREKIDRYTIVYDTDTLCVNEMCIEGVTKDGFSIIGKTSGPLYIRYFDKIYTINEGYNIDENNKKTGEIKLLMEGSDPEYFRFGYTITDDAVYWYGKKMEEVDRESFQIIDIYSDYAQDKNYIYDAGEIKEDVDRKSFHQTSYDEVGVYI